MGQRKNKTFEERCIQVDEFFNDFYHKNDMSPTFTEMSKGTGIRRGNLHVIVKQLIQDQKIIKKSDAPRGLLPAQLLTHSSFPLHLAGHIAADSLNPLVVLDLQDSETTLEVPRYLLPVGVPPSKLYVLEVHGSSMSAANILDGDYVVIQSGDAYRDDDVVVILIIGENAATLKILKQTERGSAKLQPKSHNPKHQPRIENREDIDVQGRVVAVMRKC